MILCVQYNKGAVIMKIFSVPYAIGDSRTYIETKRRVEPLAKFISFDYPGHGFRINEPLLRTIEELADDVYRNIMKEGIDEDYCLLGYSMGVLVCREVYFKLAENKCRLPKMLFLCACPSPGYKYKNNDIYNCSRDEVIEILRDYGGTSEVALQSDELMDLVIPMARADLGAIEQYVAKIDFKKIESKGIIVYSNKEKENIKNWDTVFESECDYYHIDGNHFFINEQIEAVSDIINKYLG